MISVNITTTSGRVELCGATVWSLLRQSIKPEVINIWVSKEPYLSDQGIVYDPDWLADINEIDDLVRIRFTSNTGPYRKLFPVLSESSNEDIIVYADDDVIYGRDWLSKLLSAYYADNGKYAVATRVRIRGVNAFGKFKSYNMSTICSEEKILDDSFIITGIGGCVVNKSHFIGSDIVNDEYLKIAPTTDDLWISKLLIRNGTSIKTCPAALQDIQEILHGSSALNALNVVRPHGGFISRKVRALYHRVSGYLGVPLSKNDISMNNIDSYFKENRL